MANKTLAVTPGTGATVNTLPDVGQAAMANSLPVAVASDQGAIPTAATAGEAHLGEVGGNSAVATASFSRPANTTAYAAGQAVGASTSAGAAVTLTVARKTGGTGRIQRLRLTKSGTSLTNAAFRVHLFKAAPATVPADGATFAPSGALDYLGAFPVTMTRAFGDGAKGFGVPEVGGYVTFDTVAGTQAVFALVEALQAYAPLSGEVFTLAAEVDRD